MRYQAPNNSHCRRYVDRNIDQHMHGHELVELILFSNRAYIASKWMERVRVVRPPRHCSDGPRPARRTGVRGGVAPGRRRCAGPHSQWRPFTCTGGKDMETHARVGSEKHYPYGGLSI